MQTFSENDGNAEYEKGIGTQHQLRVWDTLLETRIHLHKLLSHSNKLPQFGLFDDIIKAAKLQDEAKIEPAAQNCRKAIKYLLDNCIELQKVLSAQHPATINIFNKNAKKVVTNTEDEEITSSEDEDENDLGKNVGNKTLENDEVEDEWKDALNGDDDEWKDALNGDEDEDEEKSDEEENDASDSEATDQPTSAKKRRLNNYETLIAKNSKSFGLFRRETIQKWNDKTQVASGKLAKGNFAAFQISTNKQIDHILSDKDRLLKRTQRKNSQYDIIGKEKDEESAGQVYDAEIFEDDDFFHQLLRELIEKSASNSDRPVELSRHYLELQKLRKKLKRRIDTKASKGRKIRYDVHPKLVNFMAPYNDNIYSMAENTKTEIYKSVFRNLIEWKETQ